MTISNVQALALLITLAAFVVQLIRSRRIIAPFARGIISVILIGIPATAVTASFDGLWQIFANWLNGWLAGLAGDYAVVNTLSFYFNEWFPYIVMLGMVACALLPLSAPGRRRDSDDEKR